ncbi:MAG TPA: hypothetical protein DCS48_02390 [Desulfovibrio sp.]|nr:hypothetical protein [Desulfovibrio sp.]
MSLTKDDFEYIESKLSRLWDTRVELQIEGHTIVLNMRFKTAFERVVAISIDDEMKAGWFDSDDPMSRFLCRKKKYYYDRKYRKKLKRQSKKWLKEMNINPDHCVVYFLPWWTSFKTLFAHLKQFEDIKLIREEEG